MGKKKKQTGPEITRTIVTDGKISLSKEELIELIQLKYPEFPSGDCDVSAYSIGNMPFEEDLVHGILVEVSSTEKVKDVK